MKQYIDALVYPSTFPYPYIRIAATDQHIVEVQFANQPVLSYPSLLTRRCKQQLSEYFQHTRTAFNLPLWQNTTVFAAKVYAVLMSIPFAKTLSYKEIATVLGSVKQARAMGRVYAVNKISIIVPCHRVVRNNGCLFGYTGGITTKRWLIEHESCITVRKNKWRILS